MWKTVGAAAIALVIISALIKDNQRLTAGASPNPEKKEAVAAATPQPQPFSQPQQRRFKTTITVSNPGDIKVREGDTISIGTVLADRQQERQQLLAQQSKLSLSLQRLIERSASRPLEPKRVPQVLNLPSPSYKEEEAAIRKATLQVEQSRRAYFSYKEVANSEANKDNFELERARESYKAQYDDMNSVLPEIPSVGAAESKVKKAQRAIDLQSRKLDAISLLEELPPEIKLHEQEMLNTKREELEQTTSALENQKAIASVAEKARQEKLKTLADKIEGQRVEADRSQLQRAERLKSLFDAVEQASADLELAKSKLEAAKSKRAYDEYQHSITLARRAEEENQAAQAFNRAKDEYASSERERQFQAAQIQNQIAFVEEKLQQVSIVRSPYNGKVYKIKQLGQQNTEIKFELTIITSDSLINGNIASDRAITSTEAENSAGEGRRPRSTGDAGGAGGARDAGGARRAGGAGREGRITSSARSKEKGNNATSESPPRGWEQSGQTDSAEDD